MTEYEINEDTLAIVPEKDDISLVYELNQCFEVACSSNKIIENSCLYFGSSLEGRRRGTESLIGIHYKAPIIIEESKEIIFFPMSSTREKNTIWIGLKNILRYYRNGNGVEIEFKNNQKIFFSFSYGMIDNQILRATRLESSLRGRKN